MTAGVERYFQFARCIRDEDLRADRGFEHTQIDLEMSFMERDEVMQLVETMLQVYHQPSGRNASRQNLSHTDLPASNGAVWSG